MIIKTRSKAIFVCAVLLIIAADASAQRKRRGSSESEAILPQIDVIRVKESADEALRVSREVKREVESLNARLTQLDNRLLLLSEEVAHVSSAKIEEVELRLALLTEAYKDIYVKTQVVEHRLDNMVRPASPPKPGPAFTPSDAGMLVSSPEYDLYQSGLRLFNGRAYARAIKVFEECLNKFPEGVYRDHAQYWIGESLYQMARMEPAIEAYQKVFAYPSSRKADAAQFKIALAHQKLGQAERARAEFRKLIERYPASEYAERSKKYLEGLK